MGRPLSRRPVRLRRMADATAATLLPGLMHILETEAPGVSIQVQPLTTRDPREVLDDETADLAVGYFPFVLAEMTASISPSEWFVPRLRVEDPFTDTMQMGQLRVLGEVKSWAPSPIPRIQGLRSKNSCQTDSGPRPA